MSDRSLLGFSVLNVSKTFRVYHFKTQGGKFGSFFKKIKASSKQPRTAAGSGAMQDIHASLSFVWSCRSISIRRSNHCIPQRVYPHLRSDAGPHCQRGVSRGRHMACCRSSRNLRRDSWQGNFNRRHLRLSLRPRGGDRCQFRKESSEAVDAAISCQCRSGWADRNQCLRHL